MLHFRTTPPANPEGRVEASANAHGDPDGETLMPSYRVYHLDHHRFVGFDDFNAVDDAQAIRDSKSLNGVATSELWEGSRKVATLQPDELLASS